MDPAFALIAAVFTASLLGSLHCAGMCGAFMLFAVGAGEKATPATRFKMHAGYHAGRLVTYTALGALAGAAGAALDLGGSMVGVQRIAAAAAGAIMIAFGLAALARARGHKVGKLGVPVRYRRLVERLQGRALALPPATRAVSVGLLTTLLPCGWLYAFVITAAGTGHPALGAGAMAVFWAGTLPVLVSLGVGIRLLAGPLAARVPTITALAVIGVGLYMVVGRVRAPAWDPGTATPAASITEAANTVPVPGETPCPLCDEVTP